MPQQGLPVLPVTTNNTVGVAWGDGGITEVLKALSLGWAGEVVENYKTMNSRLGERSYLREITKSNGRGHGCWLLHNMLVCDTHTLRHTIRDRII